MTVPVRAQRWGRHAVQVLRQLRPWRKKLRRSLPSRLQELHDARVAVERAMKNVEGRFLNISSSVETTATTSKEFVEHGEALISLALGQGGGEIIIDSTAEQIWEAITFVEGNAEEGDALIQQLAAANQQLSGTLTAEQALTRTLAPLTYLQTLFKVESGTLSPEVQTMFHALVLDIERIRTDVERGFRAKFDLIRQIKAILDRVMIHLGTRTKGEKQTVITLREEMAQSLNRMKASYERNRDRDTRLVGVSQAIARDTGSVVISLQFFDAMTQKMQHTLRIIGEMETTLQSLPDGKSEFGRALRFIDHSGRICGAQLAAMNTELLSSGEIVSHGLTEIMSRIKELDSTCVALRDLDNVTTGTDGAVQILLESLADVLRLVGASESYAKDAYNTIEPIGGMTTNFTSFIRNLSFEIQLIGLNAEVQSAHVGQGTGLEVLSAQTSAISRETSTLSNRLAEELDRLTGQLAAMVESFRGIRERSIAFNQKLSAEASGLNASLHDYRDSALKVLHHIGGMLPSMETEIKTATDQADFVTIATDPLAALRTVVLALAQTTGIGADRSGHPTDDSTLTEHFFAFYTMNDEGQVHRQALGLAPAPVAGPAGEIDLFGDDVPLPDQPAATPATPPVPAVADAGDVDLWLDPAPAEPETEAVVAEEKSQPSPSGERA